jgi:hypothetical protein
MPEQGLGILRLLLVLVVALVLGLYLTLNVNRCCPLRRPHKAEDENDEDD